MKGEGCLVVESAEMVEGQVEVAPPSAQSAEDGEFKITIRKLELPVQPRGVLAE
jgi:hypothetical protein